MAFRQSLDLVNVASIQLAIQFRVLRNHAGGEVELISSHIY